ncbi:Periplasmic binding protein/LacI transcriptional regulator [Mesorhizobium plurifarium]|uniref:Periplasmic binding protein/LacI transcriptional regulator n=2 Tax=Mesorhizobium TaxID=68287 RepID=A0A090F1N1_MESPL|nr:hypothetical protein ORS3428_30695 [Mesorhizobium sp. ORS 3428]CDX33061.1 Periplasmic binding protein/LacI transcriptional regulator [Mesorhizobium sp. SOD10]CDX35382.1 Periplasmic binding protein/LacI transcriptional regulator [Mesorhizobium plurifarium]
MSYAKRLQVFMFGAAIMAAASHGALAGGNGKVAFLSAGQGFTFPPAVGRGAVEEGKSAGVQVDIFDANNSVDKQANQVDDIITQGYSGVLFFPVDGRVSVPLVAKLAAAGIPVIATSSQIGDASKEPMDAVPTSLVAYVAHDNVNSGRTIGTFATTLLPKGRKAKIAIVEGAAGYSDVVTRNNGFKEALDAAHASYEIVASQPADWMADKAETVCANMLTSKPDIDLIFADADSMGAGCARAVKAAGSNIPIVSIDGNTDGITALKAGGIAATVCNRPESIGHKSFQVLYQQISGKFDRKGALFVVPNFLVTKDNVDDCKPQF